MVDYEIINTGGTHESRYSWWRFSVLVVLYITTTTIVFIAWNAIYDDKPVYPPATTNVPTAWYERAVFYANHMHAQVDISHDIRLVRNQTNRLKLQLADSVLAAQEILEATPTTVRRQTPKQRLVCYYVKSSVNSKYGDLRLQDIDANLCTHINVGIATIKNCMLQLSDNLTRILQNEVPVLRSKNQQLKLLLWIGGGGSSSDGFPEMVRNHSTRKTFLRSLKYVMHQYRLDGVDLDWEFPSAYNKERQHLSQLLYEMRQEWRREKLDFLLSVAVAAPEGIALFAYDIPELNKYADFVNLMSYDYHFYSHSTPFTGLNAPLYARDNERSLLGTLNINYSVNWWLTNGLERDKLVVGLPTYGHSFTLVNPFNNGIGAPAEDIGRCGDKGFTTYAELCWFSRHNLVSSFYDEISCSPYLSSGTEWISYEHIKSIECKAKYVKDQNVGGVMVFSLNTDDFKGDCSIMPNGTVVSLPLIRTVRKILLGYQS